LCVSEDNTLGKSRFELLIKNHTAFALFGFDPTVPKPLVLFTAYVQIHATNKQETKTSEISGCSPVNSDIRS